MAILLTTRLAGRGDRQNDSMPVLELTYEERQRSRLAAMLPNGRAVAIVLARGESMQHGDVLCAEGGERVQVQAAAETLMLIRAANPFELMRIVYHLANRHVRAMLLPDAILIEPDPVLAELVRRLGGSVEHTQQPFLPEGGAYSSSAQSAGMDGHTHSPHSHRHHPSECGVEQQDQVMGLVGEQLSIAAHARSKT